MPLPTTFAGDSARGEGLFNPVNGMSITYIFEDIDVSTNSFKTVNLQSDSLKNIYLLGYFTDGSFNGKNLLIKYNSSFVQQWTVIGNISPNYSGIWVSIDNFCLSPDGTKVYVLLKGTNSTGSPVYEPQIMCISSTSTSTIYWSTAIISSYQGTFDTNTAFQGPPVCDPSGNVYVAYRNTTYRTGNSRVGYNYYYGTGFVKLNTSGSVVFNQGVDISGTSIEYATSLAVSPDGNYIAIAGRTNYSTQGWSFVIVYDQSQNVKYSNAFNSGIPSIAYIGGYGGALCFDPTSTYCYFMVYTYDQYVIPIKINISAGTMTSGYTPYDNTNSSYVSPCLLTATVSGDYAGNPQMVCDSLGNLYFLGYSYTTGLYFYIVKLDSNLNTLWIRQFQPTNGNVSYMTFQSIIYNSIYGVLVSGWTKDTSSNYFKPFIMNVRPTGVINNSTTSNTILNSISTRNINTKMVSATNSSWNYLNSISLSYSNNGFTTAAASSGDNFVQSTGTTSTSTQSLI